MNSIKVRFNSIALLLIICITYISVGSQKAEEDTRVAFDSKFQFTNERWYAQNDLLEGEKLYLRYCVSYHGQNAKGTEEWKRRDANGNFPPPPLNGSAHAWHHSRSVLRDYIRRGGKPWDGIMPPIEATVTDAEINSIITYFQSFWTEEIYTTWLHSNGID